MSGPKLESRGDYGVRQAVAAAVEVVQQARAAGINDPELLNMAIKDTLQNVGDIWGVPLESPDADAGTVDRR